MDKMHFTFSDLITGYASGYNWSTGLFSIRTVDGREFAAKLTDRTSGEMIRNLGEDYVDCTQQLKDMLSDTGRYLFVYGIFYNEASEFKFEAKRIVFVGLEKGEYRFEKQDWWSKQIGQLAEFYMKAQFDGGDIDYKKYRTSLTLEGTKLDTTRQETDTISRMVYGLATAFMMTGEDRYLEAAEAGTKHLRAHFRNVDVSENVAFWYHGVDVQKDDKYKKIFASEFGDDYDAIPAYEQIYALAGPTQTFRATGDPEILQDIEMTVNLFDKYFLDKEYGGYWSHIDPVTFDGCTETLGKNQGRKNWNSIGDHAPAYLINAWLATGNERYKDMLKYTADLITTHFPDYENSPFVEEKYHADWTKDKTWGWQQNGAVVGHNLKIAWNLMRIQSLAPDEKYVKMAETIAELMPKHGMDLQRGGWYDVVDRVCGEGEEFHRFAWHDRKAWWQQEQGILAYYILSGTLEKPEYLKLARESASFYNAWFPDHDAGGVYFNVLASGIPYLLGTERLKASHSMSGYHSFELCYLCAVYSNLLVTKQPMDFYFKPLPNGFKDNILRVQPDILPANSIKIAKVWIDGKQYMDFDAEGLTVKLPTTQERVKVKVRIVPVAMGDYCEIKTKIDGDIAKIKFSGNLTNKDIELLRKILTDMINKKPRQLILVMTNLQTICHEGIRAIIFAEQKLSNDTAMILVNANPEIKSLFSNEDFTESATFSDEME